MSVINDRVINERMMRWTAGEAFTMPMKVDY